MISHKHKCIFLHVHKAAGCSIEAALSRLDPQAEHLDQVNYHCGMDVYAKSGIDIDGYFKFSFVRNPYTRWLAWYRWCWYADDAPTLLDFMCKVRDNERLQIPSQSMMLFYPLPCFATHRPDFIGRYENLENDWERVCELIGVKYEPLPVRNVSPRPWCRVNWKNYYDQESKAIVEQLSRPDFEMFGYEWGDE